MVRIVTETNGIVMLRQVIRDLGCFAIAALAAFGCSGEPTSSEAPPEPAVPAASSSEPTLTGKAPRPTGGFPSVVLLEPSTPVEFPVPEEPAVMDQYGTAFHPPILLARAGQPVEFRNSEDVMHNVHVVERETRTTVFNVATPKSLAYTHTFEKPGAYDVTCNIHPSMAAFVFVTSTPYAVVADKDGNFELEGVPPGAYHLTVWNLDPRRQMERAVEVPSVEAEWNLLEMP